MSKMNHKKRGRPVLPFKKVEGFVVANPAYPQNDVNLMTQPNNGFDLSAVQFGAESSDVTNEVQVSNMFTTELRETELL